MARNASGQRDPAHDRAAHVALVPLVAGQRADHGEVAPEDGEEAADALAAAAVHLVGHRRRADLPGAEALGGQLLAGHQPDRERQVGRARRGLHQRADDIEIERAGVHLAHVGEHRLEAEVLGDAALQPVEALAVAVEQVEHVLLGADRALDPPQRVAGEEVVDPVQRLEQLLARRWRSACRAWWPGPARCGCVRSSPAWRARRPARPAGRGRPASGPARAPAPDAPGAARRSRSGPARSSPCGCARGRRGRRTRRCGPSRRDG